MKGGTAPIMDVIGYGDAVVTKGLNMLYGPGNDLVSATAMTAAGAHLILFTTGRGTPFGAPAPTLKLSTNSRLAENKKGWIDFDAGPIVEGESIDDAAKRLLQLVIEVANGKETQTAKVEDKDVLYNVQTYNAFQMKCMDVTAVIEVEPGVFLSMEASIYLDDDDYTVEQLLQALESKYYEKIQ